LESGVDFVACDNPHATPLLIHILAAVAQDEAKRISERTRVALAVVRRALAADGKWISRRSGCVITRLGNPRLRPGDARLARRLRSETAKRYAADLFPYIDAARKAGCRSLRELAQALTARGIKTPAGGQQWNPSQVKRILDREK
jgi:DNA invertase Pin-like site-specific DNA recombinase